MTRSPLICPLMFLGFMFIALQVTNGGSLEKDFYIIFLKNELSSNEQQTTQGHANLLSSLIGYKNGGRESLVYSYTKSFNAFAEKLSEEEAGRLSEMEDVVSVIPNRYRKLHTTKSWEFLGLTMTAKRNLQIESDIIVGVIDTGITPQSDSFKNHGLGPPPARWKGSCDHHFANFSGCNNKIIGAKYFKLDGVQDKNDIMSPLDVDGHGTHTSSTVAGSLVPNASLFGLAKGTARGAVPSARIAAYKVCWASSGCSDMDILAAFDAAIGDGVDIISLSLGGVEGNYTSDLISIGSFHAMMKKGILTVACAGNDGPAHGLVTNTAPWIFTVGASSISRSFYSNVTLGNELTIQGLGVNTFELEHKSYPLIRGVDAAKNDSSKMYSSKCIERYMDPKKVKGKIVYCEHPWSDADQVIRDLGGAGVIIGDQGYSDAALIYVAPATNVNLTAGKIIEDYISSTRSPTAVISKSEDVMVEAPSVASFSSRGPNPKSKYFLKPDITAPGIDILAAYTPLASITSLPVDNRHSNFILMSGTSMSCPHVSGAAAYVKSFHPNWSPAAIKSAIMTTATLMSSKTVFHNQAEFAYGSGQLNPEKALTPGLIYDMDALSYIQFLCRDGYPDSSLSILYPGNSINCSKLLLNSSGEDALNYPTMQLRLKSKEEVTNGIFQRVVTNVGRANSTYNAIIKAPKGVVITVKPNTLVFSQASQKLSFRVMVKADPMPVKRLIVSGSLTWRNLDHTVRSPIVILNPWQQNQVENVNDILTS